MPSERASISVPRVSQKFQWRVVRHYHCCSPVWHASEPDIGLQPVKVSAWLHSVSQFNWQIESAPSKSFTGGHDGRWAAGWLTSQSRAQLMAAKGEDEGLALMGRRRCRAEHKHETLLAESKQEPASQPAASHTMERHQVKSTSFKR